MAKNRGDAGAVLAAADHIILDVVYNYTAAEGNEFGPTLSFKGLDNAIYYKLPPVTGATGPPRRHRQHAQCRPSAGAAMVMDSLRHWDEACHIDGFPSTREGACPPALRFWPRPAGFLSAIGQTPCCGRSEAIAQPAGSSWPRAATASAASRRVLEASGTTAVPRSDPSVLARRLWRS